MPPSLKSRLGVEPRAARRAPVGLNSYASRRRAFAFFACALLGAVLLVLDTTPLVHTYSYIGMGNTAASPVRFCVTILAAGLVGALLPGPERLPAAIGTWLLAILVVIPALTITPRGLPTYWTVAAAPLLGFVILVVVSSLRIRFTARCGLPRDQFLLVLAALVMMSAIVVAASYGLHSNLSSLADMYSVRSDFEQRSGSGGSLPAYASGLLVNLLAPALVGLGVLWRRPVFIGIAVAGLLIQYLAVPSKLIILLPLVAALLALRLRSGKSIPSAGTIAVSGVALIATVAVLFPRPGNNAFSILVFRTFYIPDYISTLWTPFFAVNPKGHFADALLFVSNPYGMKLPALMAQLHQNGTGSANGNLWVDGYANLGMLGVAVVSLVTGLAYAVANTASKGRDPRACALILVGPAVNIINNSTFTNLLTGGLGAAIILILLLGDPDDQGVRTSATESPASLAGGK